jgi:hypothetical protein
MRSVGPEPTEKVTAVERLPQDRRAATLVAFGHTLEADVQDNTLELLEVLLTEIFSDAVRMGQQARLRTLRDLDAAGAQVSQACTVLLDLGLADDAVRATVFATISRAELEAALQQIDRLVRPSEDLYYQELQNSYRRVRRFLPALLRSVRFGASPAGQPVLEAIAHLQVVEVDGHHALPAPPLSIVDGAWRQYVMRDGTIDVKA